MVTFNSLLSDLLLPPPEKKENLNQESDEAWHNFPYTDLQFSINNYCSSEVVWSWSGPTAEDFGMVARLRNP